MDIAGCTCNITWGITGEIPQCPVHPPEKDDKETCEHSIAEFGIERGCYVCYNKLDPKTGRPNIVQKIIDDNSSKSDGDGFIVAHMSAYMETLEKKYQSMYEAVLMTGEAGVDFLNIERKKLKDLREIVEDLVKADKHETTDACEQGNCGECKTTGMLNKGLEDSK